ncbi:MATE family efflux transporter [Treponema sp.]|uniref:MATE family efflux transporter n=1 Tax=Treponema sp. TaxID=166 RepID=UPI00298DF94D|nr:MATE family efflux transporter [Treponema sp.]MCQ2241502.1 MATE family efflux transporter [Treponema sp.]
MKTLRINSYLGPLSFYRDALKIAVPVMAQALIQTMVSLIDNFMVSGLGDIKMSGVNITGQILFVFMVFLNTICMSGGIYMTQFSGARDKKGMKQAFCFKLMMGILAIILFKYVCLVIPRQFLSLMVKGNTQADLILDQGVAYMRLMAWIGIPMMVSTVIASSFRETGEVKAPLIISVIATLVNTFFNWVLIYGNLGFARLEVRGAAIATIIARLVEMVIFIVYLYVKKPAFVIHLIDLVQINFKLILEILQKGWKILFSEMVWVLSETVTTALYNGRGGADVVSGMSASFAIANLFFVAFGGITTATSVILGHTLGQGKLEEARQKERWLLTGAVIFGCIMTVFGLMTMFLVPVVFKRLSIDSQGICSKMVFTMALFMPAWVYVNAQFAISRAGGDTMMGMIVDGITNLGIILPGIFIMAFCTSAGPVMMYISIKFVDFIKITIAAIWLKKGKWIKNLAVENRQDA